MIELPDDELDKLFRKSSEELDPHFEPEDWNSLKKRLDEQDGRTAGGWIKKWWPLGMLLLLIPAGIASYYWVSSRNEEARKLQQPVVTATPSADAEKVAASDIATLEKASDLEKKEDLASKEGPENKAVSESKINVSESTASKTEKPVAYIKKAVKANRIAHDEKLTNRNSSSSKSLPRSQSKAGGVYLEPNRSKTEGGDGALILSDNKNLISDSRRTVASELGARKVTGPDGVGGKTGSDISAENPVEKNEPANEDNRMLIAAAIIGSQPFTWNNVIAFPEIASPEMPVVQQEFQKKVQQPEAKMAVRFGYSPDLSTVGLKDFVKPGAAVSLLAEYNIVPRLYLQSGVIWSRKSYFGYGESYQIPRDIHDYGPAVQSVDGVCKVFEIPLNLRYDIFRGERSIVFAGAGVSSYHMNSEVYHYSFENENDPKIKNRGWHGQTGWYLFSHLNVSAGYEYKLSSKLSLLAEPYLRVPLKRVGYGKVNLFTTGAWLSLRYTPVFKK